MVNSLVSLFGFRKSYSERRFFCARYYRATYPDVALSGQDPFQHYMNYGWSEGRNPSPDFITLYYRDRYLEGKPINPLTHYLTEGINKGLKTRPRNEDDYIDIQKPLVRPLFNPSEYSASLDRSCVDPLDHYLRRGWREGVEFRTQVSIADHLGQASYVTRLGVSPLYHYASQMRLTKRQDQPVTPSDDDSESEIDEGFAGANGPRHVRTVLSKEFDRNYYLSNYKDVHLKGIDPLEHYIDIGWREGRRPNILFHTAFYLRDNPDVRNLGVNPFFHYLTSGRELGLRPNPIGLRAHPKMEAPNDDDWRLATPAADLTRARCIVVMPVYKGYDETLAAIFAVLSAAQRSSFALHVVDDRSPDPALSSKVAELAATGLFSLSVNAENIGFVKSVNVALRRFPDQTVILMNTDAKVSGNWLDRMVAHADRDPSIATVTPLSNNATICSYPALNENNVFALEVDIAELDRLAADTNPGRSSDLPVGVGFCFLMSVAARRAVGIFDEEAFGRGYGEENDFCLRAAGAGFRNVLAEDVFVYHVGHVSFGAPTDAEPPGQKALEAKHPAYLEMLRQHLEADPTEIGRIRLDLKRLAASMSLKPTVIVFHALAGGVLTHVQEETHRIQAAGIGVILIRVGVGGRWNIEVTSGAKAPPFTPNLRAMAFGQIRETLSDFFRWLDPGLIHIQSFVGFDWNATVDFMTFVRETGVAYRFTLHDYSIVCHRNDLVLTNKRYCGLANVERCRSCVATDKTYPETIDPVVLRETYAHFLQGAERVQAPSRDIAERLHRAGARYKIEVVPHVEEPFDAPAIAPAADPSLVTVVTIGAIGAHKGSRIILSLARDAKARDLPIRYHIIGYSDITDELIGSGVTESGRFSKPQEAMKIVASLSANLIFLPSIWPETWSYTLSMAFALRVTPVTFDIGAPAARIRDEGFGEVLPYELIDDVKTLNDRLIALGRDVASLRESEDT